MRTVPKEPYELDNLARLNAAEWQIAQLSRNPEYVFWGVGEDYMDMPHIDGGWNGSIIASDWSSFDIKEPNELNEIINFYFAIERDNVKCEHCDGTGHNPATKVISDGFYDFDHNGTRWCEKITDDEVDALWAHHRLHQFKTKPTANEVNTAEIKGFVHDGINRIILIETRAKRLGVYGHCEHCEGHGYIFTVPNARLELNLWIIHPRKGAARGVRIETIQEHELPEVLATLREAAQRNAERFSKLVDESLEKLGG